MTRNTIWSVFGDALLITLAVFAGWFIWTGNAFAFLGFLSAPWVWILIGSRILDFEENRRRGVT